MTTIVTSNPIPVPSYLNCFENEFSAIRLIYGKKPSIPSHNEIFHENSVKEESIQECDLTGDPLIVDLGGDDIIEMENNEPAVSVWPKEELKHFPLSVKEGRKALNSIISNPDTDPGDLPIYVVCSGDDVDKTVLLGAHAKTLMACGIHTLGLVELIDEELEIQKMVKGHYSNCNREDIEIKYVVEIRYNVYGKPLRNLSCQNAAMRDFEKHGSVCIDVVSDQPNFKVLEGANATTIMSLELVAGHRLLRLNFIWEELQLLQKYLDILVDNLDEDTILCDNPRDENKILTSLSELIRTKVSKAPCKSGPIDLDNLREEDFLDWLWIILKQCENVSVLKRSLHFLFEELADSSVHVLKMQDKHSSIALIINRILNKNIVLPAVTLPQCVELLFELGAQKLRFDFQVLLGHHCNRAKNDIESVWQTFYQTEEKTRDTVKATRITQYLNTSSLDIKIRQLAYLCQLYVGSEFIYFVKEQVYFQEDNFDSFCQHVRNQYVTNPNVFEEFVEVYQSPRCETFFRFDVRNAEIIKSVTPSRWTMHMDSKVNSTQVTTVYDLSEYPAFPPVIYDYDIPTAHKNMVYFMSKMNQIRELS